MKNKLGVFVFNFIKYQNKTHWSINSIYREYVDKDSICISRVIKFDTYGISIIKTFTNK